MGTELVAVVLVVVPEALVLLVRQVGLVKYRVGVPLELLVLLELGLEGVVLEGVLRGHLPGVRGCWPVGGVGLDELPDLLLELGLLLVAGYTLAGLAHLAGVAAGLDAIPRRRGVAATMSYRLDPVLLENREPKHLVLEVVLFVLVVVAGSRVGTALPLGPLRLSLRVVLCSSRQFPVLQPQQLVLLLQVADLLLQQDPQLSLSVKVSSQQRDLLVGRGPFLLDGGALALAPVEDGPLGPVCELEGREGLGRGGHGGADADDEPHLAVAQQGVAQDSGELGVPEGNVGPRLVDQGRNAVPQARKAAVDAGQLLYPDVSFAWSEVRGDLELLGTGQVDNPQLGIAHSLPTSRRPPPPLLAQG